jgi:hypothetical protein
MKAAIHRREQAELLSRALASAWALDQASALRVAVERADATRRIAPQRVDPLKVQKPPVAGIPDADPFFLAIARRVQP